MDPTLYIVAGSVAISCGMSLALLWLHERATAKHLDELHRIVRDSYQELDARMQLIERAGDFVSVVERIRH